MNDSCPMCAAAGKIKAVVKSGWHGGQYGIDVWLAEICCHVCGFVMLKPAPSKQDANKALASLLDMLLVLKRASADATYTSIAQLALAAAPARDDQLIPDDGVSRPGS